VGADGGPSIGLRREVGPLVHGQDQDTDREPDDGH
jgi:hypothetical protein